MDKQQYIKPEITIIDLKNTDIITCSNPWEEVDEDLEDIANNWD